MANPVSGIFQSFQEDLGSWLNKGNRKEQLDNVAKNVTGLPNVKVKDPELFTRFLQETTPPPQPQPQQEPLPPVVGQGGLIDPERAKDFALGLAEAGSYALGPIPGLPSPGESIRNIDIGGQPLYERGKVWEGLIDPQIAMQYGRALGGPEIPEAVPFVGGMTAPEALAGGAASLTSPGDVTLTVGTAGLGPLVSGGARAGRAALAGAGRGGMLRPVGRGGLAVLENITAPIAKGPFSRRLAAEQGITLPVTTALEGTQVRQQEGTAYPWENTATALAGSLIPTIAATTLLPRAMRGLGSRISPDIEVPNILTRRDVDQPFIQESIFPRYATAPRTPRSRVSISPSVTGQIDQPATRFFPEDVIKEQNRIKELGVTQQDRAYSDLAALNARGAEYIANQNKNLINFDEGFSEIKLSGSVGRYWGDLEPSLDLEIINPTNSDLSIARIVDIADKDFNQEGIILTNRITQDDLASIKTPSGDYRNPLIDLPIGEIIEPGVTRDFSSVYQFQNRLTDDELQAIGEIFDEISPQGGFSVAADFKSIEVFTVKAYNPEYEQEVRKIIQIQHLINNYFRQTGGGNAGRVRPTAIKTRLISRESSPFNQSYSEYKNQNADRIDQLLQRQGIKGAVAPDGSIDFEQLRQARALTPEQIDEPVKIGPFGERQTNLVMGGSGTDLPEDIFENLPKNLIDDAEFKYRIEFATDAEKEFLRPFLERANARAKRGEARVLTENEKNFIKNRFLARTNKRIAEAMKPWEPGQTEAKVVPFNKEEVSEFFSNARMFIPNPFERIKFFNGLSKILNRYEKTVTPIKGLGKKTIDKLTPDETNAIVRYFGPDSAMADYAKRGGLLGAKVGVKILEGIWGLMRGLKATIDLSAVGRQQIVFLFARPITTLKSLPETWKAFRSFENLQARTNELMSDPLVQQLTGNLRGEVRWKPIEAPTGFDVRQGGLKEFPVPGSNKIEYIDERTGQRYSRNEVTREKVMLDAEGKVYLDSEVPDYVLRYNTIDDLEVPSMDKERADLFSTPWIDKIPIIRNFGRAHTQLLNEVRVRAAKNLLQNENLNDLGRHSPEVLEAASDWVNIATGEGPKLLDFFARFTGKKTLNNREYNIIQNALQKVLGVIYWSPKFLTARLFLPLKVLNLANPLVKIPLRRKMAFDYMKFVTTGIFGILLPASFIPGVEVDIRKGRISFPNGFKIGIWGGQEQVANLIIDNILDYEKSSTGTNYRVEGKNWIQRFYTRARRFNRGKLHPATGELLDHLTGTDFFGDDLDYDKYEPGSLTRFNSKNPVVEAMMPMTIAEAMEAYENSEGDWGTTIATAGAGFIGATVNNYKTKQDAARAMYNLPYVELEPHEQDFADMAYYGDEVVQRKIPRSLELKLEADALLKEIVKSKLNRSEKINAYYDEKFRIAERKQEAYRDFDFDDPFYKDQIRHGGTPEQRQALEEYYNIINNSKVNGVFMRDLYEKNQQAFERGLSKEQSEFIIRNTNFMAESVPNSLLKILPRTERNRLNKSRMARESFSRMITEDIQTQYDKNTERLKQKYEVGLQTNNE